MKLCDVFIVTISTLICGFIASCTTEHLKDLGKGYFYSNKGGSVKEIIHYKPDSVVIHANILKYGYDSLFIVAKQKPQPSKDPQNDKKELGDFEANYWIIVKGTNKLYGPLNSTQYMKIRQALNINHLLQLRDESWYVKNKN